MEGARRFYFKKHYLKLLVEVRLLLFGFYSQQKFTKNVA
jgi:hypothetical protein